MRHALDDSDADESEVVPVTHTSGNSDIVHEVKEDMSAWLPVGFNRERKMGEAWSSFSHTIKGNNQPREWLHIVTVNTRFTLFPGLQPYGGISSPSAKILPNSKSLNNLQCVLHGFNVASPSILVLLQWQNYVNYVVPNGFSTFFLTWIEPSSSSKY